MAAPVREERQKRRYDEPPQPWRNAPIGRKRLLRALAMEVVEIDGRFRVQQPGHEEHWVTIGGIESDEPLCDCGDHLWRHRLCAHAMAALLYDRDERITFAVGMLVSDAWRAGQLGMIARGGEDEEPDTPEQKTA